MFDITPRRSRDIFNFDNLFQDFFTDFEGKMMRIDIKECDSVFHLDVEVPGVNKDDINILVNDDVLTINVTFKEYPDTENTKYLRKERKYGTMSRSFTIRGIDENNITAKYENGVLCITVPKLSDTAQDKTKKIPIE